MGWSFAKEMEDAGSSFEKTRAKARRDGLSTASPGVADPTNEDKVASGLYKRGGKVQKSTGAKRHYPKKGCSC